MTLAAAPTNSLPMPYTNEQYRQFVLNLIEIRQRLDVLMGECVRHAAPFGETQTAHHLRYGAGRRIGVIKTAIGNIFEKFPPNTTRPLDTEKLHDVQINLHAFVMNVYGVFENFAWAFVERHQLRGHRKGVKWIGMFRAETRNYFPVEIRNKSLELEKWHIEYQKEYRDSLAHRIPLYVPPFHVHPDNANRYKELDKRKLALGYDITPEGKRLYSAICEEQDALKHPTFLFLHSTGDDGASRPLSLHPQIISDCMTVFDMGEIFFAHWHRVEDAG
ncbi:hypothetical protein PPN31114_03106 [Pandoraea pneumonica]|uniref:Uncharacterized protein n=1 Tax=Pandoraea pneumonica TaxID=2508299 RepID=A0A5E4W922_9BURK|nr:hypothetical protein [Pandoraea pneumonica]VVE20114.1 hypothetical protein PPN31114_03106 [Pandoraea pneumonica]